MRTVCKKLLSLMLVAILLVSAVPFQAFAAEGDPIFVDVSVYINGELVNTSKELEVTTAGVTLNSTTAMSKINDQTNRSFENWTSCKNGVEAVVTGSFLDYTWLSGYLGDGNTYTLNIYLSEVEPEPEPEPEPDPEPVPVDITIQANINGNPSILTKRFNEGDSIKLEPALVDQVSFATGSVVVWKVNNVEKANNSYVTATKGMTITCSVTSTNSKTKTISLDTKGGTLKSYESKKFTVVLGEPYGNLPTPTRDGYTFAGWFYKDSNGNENRVYNDTAAVDANLYAKWVQNGYTVQIQRYDLVSDGWTTVESHIVPAGSKLRVEDGTFPSENEIEMYYKLPNYTIVGWEIGTSDKEFKKGSTGITDNMIIRPRYQRTVTLVANNPGNYTSSSSKTITVEIGEPIGTLPNPGARDGYTFVDWVAKDEQTVISTKANLSKSSKHPEYYPNLGDTFYARWTESTVVYLYIHTNGNTQTATKIVPYYEAPSVGEFDTSLINMYSIFPSYSNYDDSGDYSSGWYSKSQWKNYSSGTAPTAATSFYNVGTNPDYAELHIMLKDNGNNSSSTNNYNNNSSTADPSNPTTGDNIFMAVSIMGVSAAALATAYYFYNKKRQAI